jgi:hypothetical protein
MVLSALCLTSEAQTLTVTLVPSDYNGYAVSCFGEKDGTLTAVISGGTPPYRIGWSTGVEESLMITDLPSGYYRVKVADDVGDGVEAEIMLLEPSPLKVGLTPVVYPNAYNISCWDCHNGTIYVDTYGGVGPFTAQWNDEATGMTRMGLGATTHYSAEVTDANGCVASTQHISLTQPERNDWGMSGNTGSNPAVNYIGTADAKDVVFKSNGQERLRLLHTGGVKLTGLAGGNQGILKGGAGGLIEVLSMESLTALLIGNISQNPATPMPADLAPFWQTNGNYLNTTNQADAFLGSLDAKDLRIKTDNTLRMVVKSGGQVQVGQDLDNFPVNGVPQARLAIRQGHGNWLTLNTATEPGAPLRYWGLHNPIEQDRLMFYFQPGANDPIYNVLTLHENGKVSIGDVSTATDQTYDYGLYVHKGLLTERVKVALKTSSEWSDHVFLSGYRLMPLAEVECFIQENGHLPGVPSADQMVEQGLDVVRTDAMLLEKIEEITIHLIQLNARIIELENANRKLMQEHAIK